MECTILKIGSGMRTEFMSRFIQETYVGLFEDGKKGNIYIIKSSKGTAMMRFERRGNGKAKLRC